ncbi:MAG: HAMP domain-containing sensor histidine kinase [Ferruginibacter sp.]
MKIQTKTTILFTIITAIFFIALDIVVYYFINEAAQNDFNKRVELRAKISAKYRFEKNKVSAEAFQQLQREYLEKLPQEKAFVFEADSTTGLYNNHSPKEISNDFLKEIIQADGATVFKQTKFRHFAGILHKDDKVNHIVIKSATNQYGIEVMGDLRKIMIITLLCFVAVSYLAGQYFSKRTFSPFRNIISKVKQINENNLHLRLEEMGGTDEIAELTETFNKMIDRIEMAFETQNNFISNASHELRTPLTAIAAEADVALSKERSPAEYRQSIQHIAAQSGKLQHLIKGLLDLAQTGFDGKKLIWQTIRLDQLIYDVKENADAILPGNNVSVSVSNFPDDENKMTITGSYDLLKVAISNIVLNACKYSGNAKVVLQLSFDEKFGKITVTDTGIGIPPDELKYIYDPFFRASNVQQYEGYGIGMPLSKNIIRLHKGKIDVNSAVNKGTTVQITLPLG